MRMLLAPTIGAVVMLLVAVWHRDHPIATGDLAGEVRHAVLAVAGVLLAVAVLAVLVM